MTSSLSPGLIIKIYIEAIKRVPRFFLVIDVKRNWVVLATMTSQKKIAQYPITWEKVNSPYYGKFINYNTLYAIRKVDFLKVLRQKYKKQTVNNSSYQLNKTDFDQFKNGQKIYFQNPCHKKYLNKIIYVLTPSDNEEWVPSYLLKNKK